MIVAIFLILKYVRDIYGVLVSIRSNAELREALRGGGETQGPEL